MTTSDRELLISRVVDGVAGPADWNALERLAADDAGVWRELASCQRDAALISAAVLRAAEKAQHIPLPESDTIRISEGRTDDKYLRIRGWAGWAAAATLLVAFVAFRAGPAADSQNTASLLPSLGRSAQSDSPMVHLDRYLEEGHEKGLVIGELPDRVIVRTQPAADGNGYEVIYLRQIMEKRTVPGLYKMEPGQDEAGRLVPRSVPAKIEVTGRESM
jgi:hypothetical protein